MKKHVYSKGDLVKVINPRIVRRVGYPLCAKDLFPEAEQRLVEAKILNARTPTPLTYKPFVDRPNDEDRLIRELARYLLREKGWGGKERSLHYEAVDNWKPGQILRFLGDKQTVQTGTRYGAISSYNAWEGDYDYEPGGLYPRKTHVLLNVAPVGDFGVDLFMVRFRNWLQVGNFIASEDVELHERAAQVD